MGLGERGLGWRGFRRFRNACLRGKRVQESVTNFWTGHPSKTMAGLYSRLDEEFMHRLVEEEAMGAGFEIPIAPGCSEISEELELELELQEQ